MSKLSDVQRVLVFGATGQQGGSVLLHLAGQKKYQLRVFVRNKDRFVKKYKEQFDQQNLDISNIEVAVGDLDNEASLLEAVSDVNIIFLNTFFDLLSEAPEMEEKRGLNVINAIKKHFDPKNPTNFKLKHVVYSSLPDFGNYESTQKRKVEQRFVELSEMLAKDYKIDLKLNFVIPTFYYENFLTLWPITKHLISRRYHWWLPPVPVNDPNYKTFKMAHFSIQDLGGIVAGIIEYTWHLSDTQRAECKFDVRKVFCVSEVLAIDEIMNTFSAILESKVSFEPLTERQFDSIPFFNDATKETIKGYSNPSSKSTIAWGLPQMPQNIEKVKYLWKLVYEKDGKEMKTLRTWGQENKEMVAQGGPTASDFVMLENVAKVTEFVSRPVVPLSIAAVVAGAGLYFYDKQYGTIGIVKK